MTRQDLPDLLYKTIKLLGGKDIMINIFQKFWKLHAEELKQSGDLFYTWKYDIRWAATKLRNQKRMKSASTKENTHGLDVSPKGTWEII